MSKCQIKFKTAIPRLWKYNGAYKLVKGIITVTAHTAAALERNNKQMTFKNCIPFTNCKSEIDNTQVHTTKDIDVVMPMYN